MWTLHAEVKLLKTFADLQKCEIKRQKNHELHCDWTLFDLGIIFDQELSLTHVKQIS